LKAGVKSYHIHSKNSRPYLGLKMRLLRIASFFVMYLWKKMRLLQML